MRVGWCVVCAVFIARSTTFFGCPMHILVVGSAWRSGEQIFRCILSGGRKKFVCRRVNKYGSAAGIVAGVSVSGAGAGVGAHSGEGAAHKVTPHLTENHIKTR